MFRRTALLWLVLLSTLTFAADNSKLPPPPPTPKQPVTDTLHGLTLTDPYRWLEDQDSPQTRKWIDEQNAYTRSLLEKQPGREAIAARIGELLKVDVVSIPNERNQRLFYSGRKATQDQSVLYMRDPAGNDKVLIDANPLSADHTMSVSFAGTAKDGSIVAYGIRRGGADEVEIHFKDTATLAELPDVMPTARYSGAAFLPDKSGFYYSIYLKQGSRVRFHKMGADTAQDAEVFAAKDLADFAGAQVTEDGRFLLIQVQHGSAADKSEVYVQDLANHGDLKAVVKDIPARFDPILAGDTAYMATNWQAENGRIIAIDLANPGRDNWREIVPQGEDSMQGADSVGGKLAVEYLHNATSVLKIFSADGKQVRELKLPGLGTVAGLTGRWESPQLFYTYVSFAQPSTIYSYDVNTGTQKEWARTKVPVDPSQFEVKQVWYESKDKTRVPMFLVYRKGLKLDGNNPTLLTGYGGFNLSRTPAFSVQAIYWAERGGVFALPNLRGGGEFGEKWHHAGMLEKKQNVFDDFISAAQWLVSNHYTRPEKLAITGGSNGGLLVGAALTQHPELFRAVICSFPLLDMVRYHQFLVARFWVPEYGSSDDPTQFKYIYAYSPYHNVKPGTKYPGVMFWSGDSDTRVAPLHARKMTALLQSANGGPNPVVLHYDVKGGHSGGQPTSKLIDEQTDQFTFLFWQLGVGDTARPKAATAAGNR